MRFRITSYNVCYTKLLRILAQTARGVDHAHGRGLLHRDLKPANVLLDANGEAKLCDFGLTRVLDRDTRLTRTGAWVGTPAYMSPEQVRGETLDARADIFAVGVV